MRKLKYFLFALVTALAAAASFLLPPLVLRSVDRRLAEEQKTVEMEPVDLALLSVLSPGGKLQQMDAPQWVTLRGGRNLNAASAATAAVEALEGWFGIPLGDGAFDCEPLLLMKDETSLLVWQVSFAPEGEEIAAVTAWVDDETGMLLALEAEAPVQAELEEVLPDPADAQENAAVIVKQYAEFYYGLGYQVRDYYGTYFDAYFMDAAMEMTREVMTIRLWDGDTGEYCDLTLTVDPDSASVTLNR